MNIQNMWDLVKRSRFLDLGFISEDNMPSVRRVFSVWQYKSLSRHFISTNTSSFHVQALLKNPKACLYYCDNETFEGVCFQGTVIVHLDRATKAFFWNPGDEQYYPQGMNDPDYCIIEFVTESARSYGNLQKHNFKREDLNDESLGIKPFSALSAITACGGCCNDCEYFAKKECLGCNATGGERVWQGKKSICEICTCCKEHNVTYCGACSEFPCDWITKKIGEWDPNGIDKLKKLKEYFEK